VNIVKAIQHAAAQLRGVQSSEIPSLAAPAEQPAVTA
jgi:hypothetical protein